jgi:hypothetical protein
MQITASFVSGHVAGCGERGSSAEDYSTATNLPLYFCATDDQFEYISFKPRQKHFMPYERYWKGKGKEM